MIDRHHGRRGARESHEPRLNIWMFAKPVERVATVAFPVWDGTKGITDWGMDGNDTLGDCGPAATDHLNVALTGNTAIVGTLGAGVFAPDPSGPWTSTEETYFAYGRSQGEPGQQPDQGVDNASWLAFLYKNGIIKGYAEVPVPDAFLYAQQFGGVLVAQALPASAESDFEAVPQIPWGSPGEVPDQSEDHDTLLIKTNADGSGSMVTWGALQPFTSDYFEKFVTDCWVILDPDDSLVDGAALVAALEGLHGTVSSAPVTPVDPVAPPEPNEPNEFDKIVKELEQILHDLEGGLLVPPAAVKLALRGMSLANIAQVVGLVSQIMELL